MANQRYEELKKMLLERRQEIVGDTRRKLPVQSNGDVMDNVELGEANIQEDIELALRQMRSETLSKINEALGRLEDGGYGNCSDCRGEISGKRLRALPFAACCITCQEAREVMELRNRAAAAKLPGKLFELEEI